MKLTDIAAGALLDGVLPGQSVTVVAVEPFGEAVKLTYRTPGGATRTALLYPKDEDRLTLAGPLAGSSSTATRPSTAWRWRPAASRWPACSTRCSR